ncbi:hypothetical protein AB0I49_28290 [Streptomyces sp. NPDC050617]|uniref:hypothetical protein n=1 Tax=Streptomyces sp. NPDC050617 TaxID=3154628 RepID=UPI00343EC5CC
MKYTKAAAVVAGSLMALGAAAPAFADGGTEANAGPGQATAGPLQDVDVKGLVGAVDELGSAFDRTQGTKGAEGAARPASKNPTMIGGLPIAAPLGG